MSWHVLLCHGNVMSWIVICHVSGFIMECKENDMTPDRDETDDCHGSSDAMDLPMADKNVIAFPHEHHWALQQGVACGVRRGLSGDPD